jgi:hypothetical protein
MNFTEFIQLLLRNKLWVFLFPFTVGIMIFFLTRNLPKTYSSEMVIYTGIASGYSVDNDINGKIDYHEANSKFDNLINTITSKETRKEVAIRLLASLIHHPQELKKVAANLRLESIELFNSPTLINSVKGSKEEETYNKISAELLQGEKNSFYQLIFGKQENVFNINKLAGIKATRLGFSDMVKVEYTCEEALVTKRTLDLLAAVFLHKYKNMKIGEVNNVVKYFQEQTDFALLRLQMTELDLKNFRTNNKVINYYEQTKYIADQKQDFEQRESQLQMEINGIGSALIKLESKLTGRSQLQLKSDEILKIKKELSEQNNVIGISTVNGKQISSDFLNNNDKLRKLLKNKIDGLDELNNSMDGISGKDLLNQWLELTINLEENKSKLNVLQTNKIEFEKSYDLFAPMGSDLNKLERDVDVAEKEYLNLLHNLNQAKLRERNLVVTENISITDPPEMPAVPNSSKRLILVIAGALSCFILTLVVLVLKEFLDASIAKPINFEKSTGIVTASAFIKEIKNNNIKIEDINTLSNERLMLSLIDLKNKENSTPLKVIAVPFHKYAGDYKTIISSLINQISNFGHLWKLAENLQISQTNEDIIYLSNSSKRELINQELLNNCNLIYLFINAAQKLDDYQLNLLENWKNLGIPVQAIMVDVKMHHLEKYLGEIPKNRSKIRKRIKDIVKRYS